MWRNGENAKQRLAIVRCKKGAEGHHQSTLLARVCPMCPIHGSQAITRPGPLVRGDQQLLFAYDV